MIRSIRRITVAAAVAAGSMAIVASAAQADPITTSGTSQQTIVEPVCRAEYAPVDYSYTWQARTTALPTGGVHLNLSQHGSVTWTQDGITYGGPFTQTVSQNYAVQDVLRDDLTVEAAGSDGSQVHAWVRIIGQIRDGQPQIDQWDVGINC